MSNKKNIKKVTEKMTDKFDFTDSIEAIKGTAKSVNTHVKEVVVEVAEDIKESGEHLRDITVAPVKKAYGKAYHTVADNVTLDNIAKTTKSVNNYTLKTAEEIVDGVIVSSEKWQGIAAKAVKGSLKLAAKQQTIVFDTLETLKDQLAENTLRFRKLFSKN